MNPNLVGSYAQANGLDKVIESNMLWMEQVVKAMGLTVVLSVVATLVIGGLVSALVGLRPTAEVERHRIGPLRTRRSRVTKYNPNHIRILLQESHHEKIEAIVRHFKLEDVKNALTEKGIVGMTVSGSPWIWTPERTYEIYRGSSMPSILFRKSKSR